MESQSPDAWPRSDHFRAHWLFDGHLDGAAMPAGAQPKTQTESDACQS